MQYEVDSYILEYKEDENKYYISFTDSVNQQCRLEIDKELFDIYMTSKKSYVKIKNETSRHLEQLNLNETEIHKRASNTGDSVEDIVLKDMETEKVTQAMKELTETQCRRIELHIINNITIRDIAKMENVQKSQIQKSLKLGLKKLKKFFEE